MRQRPVVTPGLVLGLFAIAAGVTLLLDRQGLIDSHQVFRFFWPAVFLVAGLFRLVQPCNGPGRVWGGILTAAGILMALDRLGYVHFGFWDIWPLGLIALGIVFLWHSLRRGGDHRSGARLVSTINAMAVFGGGEMASDAKDFQGGEALAVFGGYEIDLRQAAIQNGPAVLFATAVFGGVEIKVPPTWYVTMQGLPVLGGFSDHSHKPEPTDGPAQQLVIRGIAVFGGVEVKN